MKQLGVLGKQIDKMCEVNRGGTWSETPVQISYFGRFTFTNKIKQICARDAGDIRCVSNGLCPNSGTLRFTTWKVNCTNLSLSDRSGVPAQKSDHSGNAP